MKNNYDMNIENSRMNNRNINNIEQNPYIMNNNPANNFNVNQQNGFNSGDFVKGALLGAVITYLLTNKDAQESIMKAVSKGNELFQAGMEELKERYEDVKAQMEANQN